MRFIHAFYSKPLLSNKFSKYEELLDIVMTDYAYSASCIKQNGFDIILYADKIGVEMLDHIPYDEIKIVDFNESIDFAASIKFEAIKEMTKDDVLIDGDLFLQKKESFDLIEEYSKKYDFIYSFFEPYEYTVISQNHQPYYKDLLTRMLDRKHLFQHPYSFPQYFEELTWPNTSLMKFNNMDLKNEYVRQYMFFKDNLKDIDFGDKWPDIILEQYNMKCLLYHCQYTSKAMTEDFPSEESNEYSLKIGFTHLGSGKALFNEYFSECLKNQDRYLWELNNDKIKKYLNSTGV